MAARANNFPSSVRIERVFFATSTSSPLSTIIQLIQKTMTAIPVVQRIVPGAPPSIELSKSQKKKRKAAKADDSQSPVAADPADNAHAHAESNESPPGLMSRAESQAAHLLEDDQSLKQSPIADLMNKRLKAMAKKIVSAFLFPSHSATLILLLHRQGYLPMRLRISKSSMTIKSALSRICRLWRPFTRRLEK